MAYGYRPGFQPQSPLAAAASNLLGVVGSLPTPQERAMQAARAQGALAQADAARSTAALNHQKTLAAQAALAAPGELAGIARNILTPMEQARPEPEFTGPMPMRSREQAVEANWPAILQASAAINPNNIGTVARGFLATVPGLTDTSIIDRGMLAAGDNYGSTIGGTREKLVADAQQEQWKTLNTPHNISPGGVLASVAKPFIAGASPTESQVKAKILQGMTPDEQKATMLKKGIRIQNADGSIIEVGGTGDLQKSTTGNLEKNQFALQDFQDTLATLRDIGSADPTIFGTTGNMRRLWQGISEQGKNLAHLVGDPDTVNQRVAAMQRGLQAMGINANLLGTELDPNLFNIETMASLAAYQAAGALANQEGRSVSDKDVKHFRQIIGDPAAWTSSQAAFLAGLQRLDQTVNQRMTRGQQRLAPQGSAAAVQPGAPYAPPAAAPAPAAAPKRIKIDAGGNVIR